MYCICLHIPQLTWHNYLKSFMMEDRDLFKLHCHYLGFFCWCPGNAGHQVISSLGIDIAIFEYSGFNTRKFNLLWPNDTIGQHKSGSTLAQVMACCLMAPNHYLNQCWVVIDLVLLDSPDGNIHWKYWRYHALKDLKITHLKSHPREQWINPLHLYGMAFEHFSWDECNFMGLDWTVHKFWF